MDFYYMPGSAPCRTVQMIAAALGADLNLKFTNLMAGDHMKPEYLKLNPQHTIPTLVDGDFAMWESRAIVMYLIEKYGHKGYYPEAPKTRGLINQLLYFDMGTLYQRFGEYYYPQALQNLPADREKFKAIEEAMKIFNGFLQRYKYAACDCLTIADFSLAATISNYEAAGFDISKYPNVARWFELCKKTIPSYSINQAGIDQFKKMFEK